MVIIRRNKSTTDCRESRRPTLKMKENQLGKTEEGIKNKRNEEGKIVIISNDTEVNKNQGNKPIYK
jgi:hypothetical protein